MVETCHVDGVTFIGVPFCGLKGIRKIQLYHGDMTQNPTSVKIMWSNLWLKFCPIILQPFRGASWKLVCSLSSHHRKPLQQYRGIWVNASELQYIWSETQLRTESRYSTYQNICTYGTCKSTVFRWSKLKFNKTPK